MTGPARDLDGATVLVRIATVDGITDCAAGQIRTLAARGARVAVIAGLDDPAGDINPVMSLKRLTGPIEAATGLPVAFIPDCVGAVAEAGLAAVPACTIALLENLRFHPRLQRQNRTFAIRLSVLGDYFTASCDAPEKAPVWMRELATLLPEPPAPLARTA